MTDKEKELIDGHNNDREDNIDAHILAGFEEEDTDESELRPSYFRKWIIRVIALTLSLALLVNILAIWPKIINIPAIQFLKISRELSQDEDIQQYKKSVVVVEANNKRGTGFNIAPKGVIVTNHHVIDNTNNISVRFQNGEAFQTKVVISDAENDLAVLHIQTERVDLNLPSLSLAKEMNGEKGDVIYFIGNPLSFSQIANQGQILDTVILSERKKKVLVIDAPVYKGNSGSPVINQEGKVIAVINATSEYKVDQNKQRVGLAVPISYLHSMLRKDLEKEESQKQ